MEVKLHLNNLLGALIKVIHFQIPLASICYVRNDLLSPKKETPQRGSKLKESKSQSWTFLNPVTPDMLPVTPKYHTHFDSNSSIVYAFSINQLVLTQRKVAEEFNTHIYNF